MKSNYLKNESKRFVELDSLRGLAALAVVVFHFTIIAPRFVTDFVSPGFRFPLGHFGVELFFIVSGFVIFMTLNRCETGMDFVVSRAARLYPTFWASMTLTFVIGSIWPLVGQEYNLTQYLVNLTMTQEYVFVRSVDPVYWTLSYELGFYIAMFGLFSLGLLPRIQIFCALWIVGAGFFHFFPHLVPHPLHYLFVVNAFGHLFAAGIIIYLMVHDGVTKPRLALLTLVPVVQWAQEGPIAGAIIAAFIGVFLLAANGKIGLLRWKPLVALGTISYSLYVVHHMIGFRVIDTLQHYGMGGVESMALAIACCVLLAFKITFLVEKPAQRFIRNRWNSVRLNAVSAET